MIDLTKLHRRLLKLYPASFREEYEAPMDRHFRDEQRDAQSWKERARLWIHVLCDVANSAPRELNRELGQDLHFALRVYRKRPLSAALAVGALALAIGVSTGVFSVASALLLRSLPFRDAGRLVELSLSPFNAMNGRAGFAAWRDRSTYLESAATFSISEMNLNSGRDALRVRVAETSANFFGLLGARCSVGRAFASDEDKPGQGHVALISHRLWQQSYGKDPAVLGNTLQLNGVALTIIGVAEPSFDYPGDVDVWIPTVFDFEIIPRRGAFLFQTIGRLQPGVTMTQARQQFEAEARRVSPEIFRSSEHEGPELVGFRDQITSQVRQSVLILSAVVLLVLLTACANVAQLLLSRTAERHQELALRAALGASRSRLIQQLTIEATALTLTGSTLGLIVAFFVCRIASAALPAQLVTQNYTILDWRVLCFAIALALLVGGIFGVMPAWLIGRLQPSTQLARVHPGASEPTTRRLRSILVGLQVALTLTLVVSSLTLGSAFLLLLGTDLGFRPANVVTLNVSLQGTRYQKGSAEWQYYSSVLDRLRSLPGVESAGAVNYLPLTNGVLMAATIKVDSGQQIQAVVLNGAMPGYFKTMGTGINAGRDFAMAEGNSPEPPVIVNEAFARQSGLGTSIVGRRIIGPWTPRPYLVSGVVATARMAGPEYDGSPQAYWPVEEEPPPALTFVAKVHGDSSKYLTICRDAVAGLDRAVPVYEVKTLDQRLSETLVRPKFYTTSVLFLGCLALLLAIIGVYGTSSRAITQRQHELGIRMALGASARRVRAMILRQSLVPVGVGVIAGVGGAMISGPLLQHLFAGAKGLSVQTCIIASILLLVTAMGAAWFATARILTIDPIDAIRAE
jgi:putative ABC transport system permease protein